MWSLIFYAYNNNNFHKNLAQNQASLDVLWQTLRLSHVLCICLGATDRSHHLKCFFGKTKKWFVLNLCVHLLEAMTANSGCHVYAKS